MMYPGMPNMVIAPDVFDIAKKPISSSMPIPLLSVRFLRM
jgi:hypothetical protein